MTQLRQKKGQEGEAIALKNLKKRGYQVMARNFRWRGGEIDIIAIKKNRIIFVEVKYYKSHDIHPLEVITSRKKRHLKNTAQVFIQQLKNKSYEFRFDLIIVEIDKSVGIYRNIDIHS